MKKLILPLIFISSCDHIGSSRTKNLIDLTPKLTVDGSDPSFKLTSGREDISSNPGSKSYLISKEIIISKPAIAKDTVYSVDRKGNVVAFSLTEKKRKWTTNIAEGLMDRNFNGGGVLYSNGKLYITKGSRYLIVLDALTGHESIRKEFPDIIRTKPVMAGENTLIVQTASNQLLGYNVDSSNFIWMHEGGIETISAANHVHPTIYDDFVLASYSSGEIVYLNTKTGDEKWHYSLANITAEATLPSFQAAVIITQPIIKDNFAYFASSNGKIIKLDLTNGMPVWVKAADDVLSMSMHENTLLVTNNARQIAAINTNNAKITWVGDLISKSERSKRKPKPTLFQPPFVAKDGDSWAISVVASNGQMYKFIADDMGKLPTSPTILSVSSGRSGILYSWISCCHDKIYLISSRKIVF